MVTGQEPSWVIVIVYHVTHAQLGRRIVNGTEYLTAPPGRTDMDEDKFESMLGSVVQSNLSISIPV